MLKVMLKENKLRIILITIIIILIILSILLNILARWQNKQEINPPAYSPVSIETVKEGTIIPKNSIYFFSEYANGKSTSKEIYETIDYFAKTIIPKYTSEISSKSVSEIEKYYSNSKNLENDLIEANSLAQYKKIVELLSKYDSTITVKDIEFISKSVVVEKNYTGAGLRFKFSDGTKVNFKMRVYDKPNESGRAIFFSI